MDPITLLRSQAEEAHGLTTRMIEGLAPAEIHWRPPGLAHPIGATYAHMVLNEDWLVQALLLGGAPWYEGAWMSRTGCSSLQPGDGAWEEWARTVEIDLSALQEYARAVYTATDSYLATLQPEGLDREIPFPSPRQGTRPLSGVLSAILIRHHANHCGEIAVVKGLQGLRGYPF